MATLLFWIKEAFVDEGKLSLPNRIFLPADRTDQGIGDIDGDLLRAIPGSCSSRFDSEGALADLSCHPVVDLAVLFFVSTAIGSLD